MSQRALVGIIGGLVLIVGLLIGLLVGGGSDDDPNLEAVVDEASAPTTSTTEAPSGSDDATASDDSATTTTSTTTTSTTTTTTTTLPSGSGTIVAGSGVAGWSAAGQWFGLDDGFLPATAGETYQVIKLGEPVTTVVAGDVTSGCEFIDPSADVDGIMSLDDWPDYPVAVAANWNVVPHKVEVLSNDNQTYKDAVSDVLNGQGVIDPDPTLRQVIQTDLEGDGVEEVLIVAGYDGPLFEASPSDYSITIMRKLIEGQVQTAILSFYVVPPGETEDLGWYFESYRIAAVADLNGDGRMEIVTNDSYFEGGGSRIIEYLNDDLGPWEVLHVGCGV